MIILSQLFCKTSKLFKIGNKLNIISAKTDGLQDITRKVLIKVVFQKATNCM